MNAERLSRQHYREQNKGVYDENIEIASHRYNKVADLRYGTNPHQTAALYSPVEGDPVIAASRTLKSGKGGLSQTNLEDISGALNICKFFSTPCCACMKHVNPSGAAVEMGGEKLSQIYLKARDADPQAAFGSVVAFNTTVDEETASEIMGTFVECVTAPGFTEEALKTFEDYTTYGRNRNIRILECGDLDALPKFAGEDVTGYRTMRTLADGSIVVADPLLTHVESHRDLPPAESEDREGNSVCSRVVPTEHQYADLQTAWYVTLNVRSNGVVIVKNGQTLAVGTGQQDRVGAVQQALHKYETKYQGQETVSGACMASDGFFPFPDALAYAAEHGIGAVVAPAGSMRDAEVVQCANERGVALCHAPERVFSHH